MSRTQRLVFIAISVALVVGAVIIFSGGDDDESTPSKTTAEPARIVVTGGKPEGGPRTLTYKKGDRVDLTVESDTADEVHIHGYDLMKDVEAGGTVQFSFDATLDGIFEIELEKAKEELATLRVEP